MQQPGSRHRRAVSAASRRQDHHELPPPGRSHRRTGSRRDRRRPHPVHPRWQSEGSCRKRARDPSARHESPRHPPPDQEQQIGRDGQPSRQPWKGPRALQVVGVRGHRTEPAGANGDGTVYQRKDNRWEAAGYVLAPGNTRKCIRVYGSSRKEALAKLSEKIAASNRGLPAPPAQGSLAAYLTYWLDAVAVHQLRENTPHPLHRCHPPLPHPRPRTEEARQTHRQGRPHLAQPAPHHLPMLRAVSTPPVSSPSAALPESAAQDGSHR